MKTIFLLLAALIISTAAFAQNVGINADGSAPDASAMLDVSSTSKGFLAPRMTEAHRMAMTGMATGLLVYQTDGDYGYYYYQNSAESWFKVGTSAEASQWTTSGSNIYYNSGNVGIGTATPEATLEVEGMVVIDYATAPGFYGKVGNDYKAYLGYDGSQNNGLHLYNYASAKSLKLEDDGDLTYLGNVGIGTTSPLHKLDVVGNGRLYNESGISKMTIQTNGSIDQASVDLLNSTLNARWILDQNNLFSVFNQTSTFYAFVITADGKVGIGTTLPSYKLHVNGEVAGVGAYVNASDRRLKKDVINIENGLNKVMMLRPVTFNWRQSEFPNISLDDRNHIGFIAQEVEEVVPQVVTTADDEMQTKSIAYSDLVPLLTKAIQEQQQLIEDLQKQNAILTEKANEFDELKAEVENIKKIIGAKSFIAVNEE